MTVKLKENWRGLLKNPPPTTRTISTSTPPVPASPAIQAPTGRQGTENTPPSPVGRAGQPPMPTRRAIRPGATPSAAERITSATPPVADTPAQPDLSKVEGPATSKPVLSGVERAQEPTPAVQAPPAAEITPPPEEKPIPEEPPVSNETEAKIKKLIGESGPSKITNDEAAKLKKLSEELGSSTLNADEAEAKIDELNNLINQLEEKTRASEQPAKSQPKPADKPGNGK